MKKQAISLLILLALAGCGEKTETAGGPVEPKPEKSAAQNLVSFCVKKDGPCGYFDTVTKQFAIPPQFDKAYGFSKRGLAEVVKDGKAGFINIEGNIAAPLQFSWVGRFNSKGVSAACQEPGKCGYINTAGNWVIPPQFEKIYSSERNLIAAMQYEKWGYINTKGQWEIAAKFETAEDFSENGLALVKQDGKYGYIDTSGQMTIPPQFKYAYSFNNYGLAEVSNHDGKKGFIDAKGDWVIQPQFDRVYGFEKNGLAAFSQNGKDGWINTKGQIVIPAQFEFSIAFSENGLAATQKDKNSNFGYINTKGQWVIPEQFSYAGEFSSAGMAYIKMNGKCGYIDEKGQLLVPPLFDKCDQDDVFEKGVAEVQQGERSGYIDSKGRWIVYRDTVCDTPVVKNADDQVIWPKKPVADICAEATYAKQQADAAKQRAEEQACSHVYVGKEFRAKAGIFGWEQTFIVEGFSKATQQVTIRSKGDSYRQEISCYQVP